MTKKSPYTNLKTRTLDHLLENYRKSQYRTTRSGRRVRWDEPGEDDSDEVRRHNAHIAQRLKQRRDAKEHLKKKGAVPTRDGNPIFEKNLMTEDLQRGLMAFRNLYASNRQMRFRDWIEVVAELLDDL